MKFKVLLGLVLAFCFACSGEKNDSEDASLQSSDNHLDKKVFDKKSNVNLTYLLDLSDRIDTNKHQQKNESTINRDLEVISSLTESFFDHIYDKRLRDINDHLLAAIEPQPEVDNFQKVKKTLDVELDFRQRNTQITKEEMENKKKSFLESVKLMYAEAAKQKRFPGSNIWQFLRDKEYRGLTEQGKRNVLVIFTDGYMYYKGDLRREGNKTNYLERNFLLQNKLAGSDFARRFAEGKYGFILATRGLENLEVIVVGLTQDNDKPVEREVLELYWQDWLTRMGVKSFKIIPYIPNVDPLKLAGDFLAINSNRVSTQ